MVRVLQVLAPRRKSPADASEERFADDRRVSSMAAADNKAEGAVADGVAAIHTHVAGAVERVAHSYEGSRRAARRSPSSQRAFAPRPRCIGRAGDYTMDSDSTYPTVA